MMNKKGTVVIVDDIEAQGSTFKQYFSDSFEIYAFTDAEDALKSMEDITDVDVVISDEVMPGMAGHDFLTAVKKRFPNVQRIITTAYSHDQHLLHCYTEAQIHSFVRKPWDLNYLEKTISKAINKKRDLEEFASKLGSQVSVWQNTLINQRIEQIESILSTCGFSDPKLISASFFEIINQISEKSKVEWTDADLFDDDGESQLMVSIFNKMLALNAETDEQTEIELTELKRILDRICEISVTGNISIEPNHISVLFSLGLLISDCCFDEKSIAVKEHFDSIKVDFETDMGFGYGIHDVLCGYENTTLLRNVWLLNIVARTIECGGSIEIGPSFHSVSGKIIFE